jgi:hypothetical protein
MRITILWEDQQGAETKNFGPHELLLSCLSDQLSMNRNNIKPLIFSIPKKGNSNVRKALQTDGERLANHGPVFAVVDRDKIQDLWRNKLSRLPNCMSGISQQFHHDAPSTYELIFLLQNMESLLDSTYSALCITAPANKPSPNERDGYLMQAVWSNRDIRDQIQESCISFKRIVHKVSNKILLLPF